jgi:seryl-tRNA synthetase
MTLYELDSIYGRLIALYNTVESDEEREQILAQLQELDERVEHKIDQLHRAWRNQSVEVTAVKEELSRLTAYAKRLENRESGLKEIIKEIMLRVRMLKVTTSIGGLRIQKNSTPTVIYEGNAELLPEEFRIVKCEPNKKALAEKYKEVIDRVNELERQFYESHPDGGAFDFEDAEKQARKEFNFPLDVTVEWGNHLRNI